MGLWFSKTSKREISQEEVEMKVEEMPITILSDMDQRKLIAASAPFLESFADYVFKQLNKEREQPPLPIFRSQINGHYLCSYYPNSTATPMVLQGKTYCYDCYLAGWAAFATQETTKKPAVRGPPLGYDPAHWYHMIPKTAAEMLRYVEMPELLDIIRDPINRQVLDDDVALPRSFFDPLVGLADAYFQHYTPQIQVMQAEAFQVAPKKEPAIRRTTTHLLIPVFQAEHYFLVDIDIVHGNATFYDANAVTLQTYHEDFALEEHLQIVLPGVNLGRNMNTFNPQEIGPLKQPYCMLAHLFAFGHPNLLVELHALKKIVDLPPDHKIPVTEPPPAMPDAFPHFARLVVLHCKETGFAPFASGV